MAKPEVQVALAKTKLDADTGQIIHDDTAAFLGAHLAAFETFTRRCAEAS